LKKVVIVGAGAGGLSLLRQIKTSQLPPMHILVVDPDPKTVENRNWCQWVKPHELSSYHTTAWTSIRTATQQGSFISKPTKWMYARTTGGEYRSEIDVIPSLHHVEWVKDNVTGIEYDNILDKSIVTSDRGQIEADFVFTSVNREQVTPFLWQHFHGWEVEANIDVFDPNCATLMDFNVAQVSDGVVFMYVLPYSARRGLVECTVFSPTAWDISQYEQRLVKYMEDMFSLSEGNYMRLNTETGRIPMHMGDSLGPINPKTWPIGSLANTIKPSTGYAFTRIQNASQQIVQSWEQTGRPSLQKQKAGRFSLYDMLMLNIIQKDPSKMLHVFGHLFRYNSIDNIFSFLDEQTSLAQEAQIFMQLPKTPFIKALWRTVTS